MGMFGLANNEKYQYPNYFQIQPAGPDPQTSTAIGFFELAARQDPKPQTVAMVGADAEYPQNALVGARELVKRFGFKTVYDKTYPPSTVEFSGIIRALKAAKPDIVYVASYPPDSAGILRAVNEIGIGDNVKVFGGGMVGLQFGAVMENLGSLLNGVVNYNSWLPEKSMYFNGTKEFFEKYTKRAIEAKVDPLGYYLAPFGYASGQLVEGAINATKSLDQKGLAKYLRENTHQTIVGPIAFSADGERKETAVLQAQFRGVADKNIEQFRTSGKQVILFPENLKSGELVAPFEAARK